MPLISYKDARPWAKAIREAVLLKRMPPWFADPRYGKFSNDHSLSEEQIKTVAAWADAGAPEGDPQSAPKPQAFTDGWTIPTPDKVLEMSGEFDVPASGKIDYQYIIVPTGFTEDKWVQMVEVRPSNRAVVHHSVIFLREPGSKWLSHAQPGVPVSGGPADTGGAGNEILSIYTPGMVPDVWEPGTAKQVKAGTDLVIQMHYTANGKAGKDKTKVGVIFAKQPPTKRVLTLLPANTGFRIPPGDPNYRVDTRVRIPNPTEIISFFPHMHLRGKAFEYRVTYPTGETQTLLRVDPYKFDWQLSYQVEKPVVLPAGTVFECSAWFDNSPNNPNNPDPAKEVRWGEQSWEEMMIGFVDVAIDATWTRRDFFTPKPAGAGN
ncbi:MAG: thiol-disulfide isomerase [Acidimicrobiia bacterium]|nr:thiol-disulfide isomerase [Acidimicrobiia bacterium]